MTTRRGFLAGILAAAAAPAIVRAGSLMPVAAPIWTPPVTGFVPITDYVMFMHPDVAHDYPDVAHDLMLYEGVVGRYENIRIIENISIIESHAAAERTAAAMLMQQNAADRQLRATLERFRKKIRL